MNAFKEALFEAGKKCDGHVTNGSLAAQWRVITRELQELLLEYETSGSGAGANLYQSLKELIQESARVLQESAEVTLSTFVLPRPGCGNGRLTWEQVKPVIDFLPDNVLVISR